MSTEHHGIAASFTQLDVNTPAPARMYDYWLAGKDNFKVDRDAAEEVEARLPTVRPLAWANRAFLTRVVRYLAGECGIRQFLDVGSGLPTRGNVHEIAQDVARDARVVYVDNDPVVLTHGRAILAANDDTAVIRADLREPQSLFEAPELRQLIDPAEPVAVLMIAVLHFVRDEEEPAELVRAYRKRMAPGSYLALSHVAHTPAAVSAAKVYERATSPVVPRSCEEGRRFFEGFELVDPGVVQVTAWRPDEETDQSIDVPGWGGVGRYRDAGVTNG